MLKQTKYLCNCLNLKKYFLNYYRWYRQQIAKAFEVSTAQRVLSSSNGADKTWEVFQYQWKVPWHLPPSQRYRKAHIGPCDQLAAHWYAAGIAPLLVSLKGIQKKEENIGISDPFIYVNGLWLVPKKCEWRMFPGRRSWKESKNNVQVSPCSVGISTPVGTFADSILMPNQLQPPVTSSRFRSGHVVSGPL